MIPLYKLFAVTARLFTKPLVTILKKRHKSGGVSKNSLLERLFIFLGNREYKMDLWMNRKLLNIDDDGDMFVKSLNKDVALEKGIEFFYEILIYSCLILITLIELRKYSNDQDKKKKKDEETLRQIYLDIEKSGERFQEKTDLFEMKIQKLEKQNLVNLKTMQMIELLNEKISEIYEIKKGENSNMKKLNNDKANEN